MLFYLKLLYILYPFPLTAPLEVCPLQFNNRISEVADSVCAQLSTFSVSENGWWLTCCGLQGESLLWVTGAGMYRYCIY